MNEKQHSPPPSGLGIGDIYYILFRHKWKIMLISLLGIAAAGAVYFVWPVDYGSEAKLFVRYVVETKSPAQAAQTDASIKSPDQRGESVINTELEILTSLDLAQQVADAVGPEKILGKDGGTNRLQAGGMVHRDLVAEVTKNSSVIHVAFRNPDPAVVQPVLNQVIQSYLKKHAEIHRGGVFDNFLTQQTDELRSRLLQTEADLSKAKDKAGVISLDDSKKEYADQISKIEQTIMDGNAELVQRQAAAEAMAKSLNVASPVATNQLPPATNDVTAPVPPDKIAEYRRVSTLLETLVKRDQELSIQFTPESLLVKSARDQVAAAEKQKKQLEADNPGLLITKVADPRNPSTSPVDSRRDDLATEISKIRGIAAKINFLTNQLSMIRSNAAIVGGMEGSITDLQRKKELEEAQYKYYKQNLEQTRIDDQLGAGKNANIGIVQTPSPPFRDIGKLYKALAGIVLGGFALAFGLAFVIELYLDQSLKRPADVERRIGLPLFISIPALSLNGKSHGLLTAKKPVLLTEGNGHPQDPAAEPPSTPALSPARTTDFAPWDPHYRLRPYYEALRDRLINYFEVRNLTHKPKLVAVTSCGEGSGVSSTAAGLAASLSETGEGNVLLVDMNIENGSARQFYQGELTCDVDDALEMGKRGNAQVQENLYVVSETNGSSQLPSALPRRFKHLVPRLKASDYDYIIFDMPPVSQISLTPRLAKFMDMVLMVVESGKTDREVVKKASALLAESKANVGIVLNKQRAYIPKRLRQEL